MGGSIFTKQSSQLQFKAKSDSALETIYLIQLNHITIKFTHMLHNSELARIKTKTFPEKPCIFIDIAEIFTEIILCPRAGLRIIFLFACLFVFVL